MQPKANKARGWKLGFKSVAPTPCPQIRFFKTILTMYCAVKQSAAEVVYWPGPLFTPETLLQSIFCPGAELQCSVFENLEFLQSNGAIVNSDTVLDQFFQRSISLYGTYLVNIVKGDIPWGLYSWIRCCERRIHRQYSLWSGNRTFHCSRNKLHWHSDPSYQDWHKKKTLTVLTLEN